MEAFREVGVKKEDLRSGFAAALNEQGRFAPTRVGDFEFVPVAGRHVWKGRVVSTPAELAECVNGAMKSIIDFRDPFQSLEVIKVGSKSEELGSVSPEVDGDLLSLNRSLLQANEELRGVIASIELRQPVEAAAP